MLFSLTGNLTQESLQAFIDNPIDRFQPASQLVEAVGGKLLHMYHAATGMTLLLFDAPDLTTVTAISTSIQAINRLTNVEINRLQTTAEFVDGLRLAQKTRPVNQLPQQ
jgi:hypothetical protein